MQPCMSPVWDTAYALFALGESGVPANDPRMVKCADWILQKQVRMAGDWKVKNKQGQPGGWYFEFNNEFYPDVDDSAMVCLGLSHVEHPNGRYQRESVQRAIDWILSMQCRNGGWASFDKDNTAWCSSTSLRRPQRHARSGDGRHHRPHPGDAGGLRLRQESSRGEEGDRSLSASEQEPDGSWFGRWGVNYIYGTMLVLRGLEAMGVDHHEPYVQQAAEWLRMVQNPDGGWGETCGSYDDPNTKGVGPSTPSQTAWAIMGLLAADDTRSDSVVRGIAYLLRTQKKDGSWDEPAVHGHRLPARVLPGVPHVSAILPADRALTAYQRDGGNRGRGSKPKENRLEIGGCPSLNRSSLRSGLGIYRSNSNCPSSAAWTGHALSERSYDGGSDFPDVDGGQLTC